MCWFHEDPEHTLRSQITQSENNELVNIYDLSISQCWDLEKEFNIYTIGKLVDYIIHYGFPKGVEFSERTKFVLTMRAAKKFLDGF